MRGRQQAHAKIGVGVMDDFFKIVEDVSVQEKRPTIEGRNIIMILVPNKAVGAKQQGGGQQQQAKPAPQPKTETAATTSMGDAIKSAKAKKPEVTAKS